MGAIGLESPEAAYRFILSSGETTAWQGCLPGTLSSLLADAPSRAFDPSEHRAVMSVSRLAPHALVVLALAVVVAGCGTAPESSPAENGPSPSTGDGMAVTDLSVIGCARDDPADEGELTGAWSGNDSGTYYIRQVGDCVWWFGTEVRDIELGPTGQRGFANVASGRMVGSQVDLEWVDVPLGYTVNGGGLTFTYDAANDQLTLVEQRGGRIPFGGTVLTRIQPDATSSATPSATPTP
jgi:hypothetical protein